MEPAKTYPFPLDPFQQQAIGYIDNDESVLVAAHTSAGKTVAAEYAIAKSLKAGQVCKWSFFMLILFFVFSFFFWHYPQLIES